MSMACSIESRVPFLDHKFVEFAASVPPHMKLRGKEGKYILKKAVAICFRKASSTARSKASPRRFAMAAAGPRQSSGRLSARSRWHPGHVCESATSSKTCWRSTPSGKHDATDRIWRLLNLQVWGDMYLTGRREQFWDGLMPVPAGAAQTA